MLIFLKHLLCQLHNFFHCSSVVHSLKPVLVSYLIFSVISCPKQRYHKTRYTLMMELMLWHFIYICICIYRKIYAYLSINKLFSNKTVCILSEVMWVIYLFKHCLLIFPFYCLELCFVSICVLICKQQ
jgi:hypothetical protein